MDVAHLWLLAQYTYLEVRSSGHKRRGARLPSDVLIISYLIAVP